MTKRNLQACPRKRVGMVLAVAAAMLCQAPAWRAQSSDASSKDRAHRAEPVRPLQERLPAKPTQAPEFTIPVGPLGFTAPGALYLGERIRVVSLDFLDENRLLFTFRVPGLIRRAPGDSGADDERQIRAVVLALPTGIVECEALWTVHDRSRYLWMLKDGHFLLRDRDLIEEGDATLELKPLLRFPGPLTWMDVDPTQQYLVTDSREPGAVEAKPGEVPNPSAAAASMVEDAQATEGQKEIVVRILRRDSGQVMLVSHTRTSVHLPINNEGYLESLRATDGRWLLMLNYFTGGQTTLGRVDSTCSPTLEFAAPREVVATTCDRSGGRRIVALTTDGRRLWADSNSNVPVWPLLVKSADGLRLARESLALTHPISANAPLDNEDIKGQLVEVFDAATGQVALTTTATPVLDAGGNVAISPSGRRVAAISEGAIQVFELAPPPALP